VELRLLKAKGVVPKDNDYFEMPFEVQADGPYFNVLDFFQQAEPAIADYQRGGSGIIPIRTKPRADNYSMRPGTTVSGTFTATLIFPNLLALRLLLALPRREAKN